MKQAPTITFPKVDDVKSKAALGISLTPLEKLVADHNISQHDTMTGQLAVDLQQAIDYVRDQTDQHNQSVILSLLTPVRQFIQMLDKTEVSDEGSQFHPNTVSACKTVDSMILCALIIQMRAMTGKGRLRDSEYYQLHHRCPNCSSDDIKTTLMTVRPPDGNYGDPYWKGDDNKASCNKCDWNGVINDLTP